MTEYKIQLSPFAKSFLPIYVECKHHKSMAVYNWWEQCVGNTPKGMRPVLFLKANHKEPLAVISLDDYMDLEEARIEEERITR